MNVGHIYEFMGALCSGVVGVSIGVLIFYTYIEPWMAKKYNVPKNKRVKSLSKLIQNGF